MRFPIHLSIRTQDYLPTAVFWHNTDSDLGYLHILALSLLPSYGSQFVDFL